MKKPAFQFYPGDWRKDQNLSRASLKAKGALIEILCLAFECEKRGYLKTGSQPWTIEEIAHAMGGDKDENISAIEELLRLKVLKKDKKNTIFSSRMVRDEKLSKERRRAGHLGGNPQLKVNYNRPGYIYFVRRKSDGAIKIGVAVNVKNRFYKLRHKHKEDDLELIKFEWVNDMGKCESELHILFKNKIIEGEWFKLSELELQKVDFTLKGKFNQNPTPSSSSSTSTSVNTTTVVVDERSDRLFEMFRRAAGRHIGDDELRVEVAKFLNKYPNIHPNQAGALVNAWVNNIGRQPQPEKRMIV